MESEGDTNPDGTFSKYSLTEKFPAEAMEPAHRRAAYPTPGEKPAKGKKSSAEQQKKVENEVVEGKVVDARMISS